MKRRTLFSIIVVTLVAGCFTLFYGAHSTWTDTQSAHAVQAATNQVDTLFKDSSHQLPAAELSQEKIAAAEASLQAARRKLTEPEQANQLASAQADVDAAKQMLTVKNAVAQKPTKLTELQTLTSESQQALAKLAKQKPTFVQTYQKQVAQLSDQEAAVAKVASLFTDADFKEPKSGLSTSEIQAALAALKHIDNQQLADQMLPAIATAQQAASDDTSSAEASVPSSTVPSSSASGSESSATNSQSTSSGSSTSNESDQSQQESSNSSSASSASSSSSQG
ncbi:hypothetical protein [Lacticaseibacillus zeae]|uniref:Lipoprotein n=1 Tax=Lacticaseibacillus zeae subsp. silagei TaxID=3068307 RepID=A0ABD7Z9V4_LACZE|nr:MULTISPECIES: hypothetical protein [Lacticaseibacillus]MDE3316701.1 hypothetical protein [Lacticaseibacillus zeae]OFR97333.1 hypothetical protein HMPREF2861_06955 [Lactobacillus sp. HMSC068F07]WLV83492.1 hypothetical protein LACZS2_002734 [Lacticaseibacillus sp. NCIMB 15475]WLV86241.1 hypothetical protein LACZS1_002682 [Lacticaseibacillus sp. NCIMB 15474]